MQQEIEKGRSSTQSVQPMQGFVLVFSFFINFVRESMMRNSNRSEQVRAERPPPQGLGVGEQSPSSVQ